LGSDDDRSDRWSRAGDRLGRVARMRVRAGSSQDRLNVNVLPFSGIRKKGQSRKALGMRGFRPPIRMIFHSNGWGIRMIFHSNSWVLIRAVFGPVEHPDAAAAGSPLDVEIGVVNSRGMVGGELGHDGDDGAE